MTSNKTFVRAFYQDIWNNGMLGKAGDYITESFVDHNSALPPGAPGGLAGAAAVFQTFRNAFPDLVCTVDDMIEEGDKVMTRWTSRGTNTGSLMGMPPTGKPVSVNVVEVYRIVGGKIVERWGLYSQFEMLQQLGVIPVPQM